METATGQTATPRGIAIHATHSYQALSGTRDQYRTRHSSCPLGAYSLVGIALNLRSAGDAGEERSVQLLSASRSPRSSFHGAEGGRSKMEGIVCR